MERKRPAVRGLRPEREDERLHARSMHALHAARAHLANARKSLEIANASAAEAADAVRALSGRRGVTSYAEAWSKAAKLHAESDRLEQSLFDDSLELAALATSLMDVLRDLESARWS